LHSGRAPGNQPDKISGCQRDRVVGPFGRYSSASRAMQANASKRPGRRRLAARCGRGPTRCRHGKVTAANRYEGTLVQDTNEDRIKGSVCIIQLGGTRAVRAARLSLRRPVQGFFCKSPLAPVVRFARTSVRACLAAAGKGGLAAMFSHVREASSVPLREDAVFTHSQIHQPADLQLATALRV